MKKLFNILFFILLNLLLTSCYDNVELEDRAFVISIGIDKEDDLYKTTLEIKESENKCYIGSDKTLTSAINKVSLNINKHLYFGHTKLIVFGEELLKDKKMFQEALNSLEKNHKISRKIITIASKKNAGNILEEQIEGEGLGITIANYFRNSKTYGSLKKSIEIIVGELRISGSTLIPKLTIEGNNVNLGEAFVMKDYKLVGELNENEIDSFLLFKGLSKGGTFVIEHDNKNIPIEVKENKTKISFDDANEKIICNVKIYLEVTAEGLEKNNIDDINRYVKDIKVSFEDQVKQNINNLYKKFKNEYVVDEFSLINTLRKYNYDIFKNNQKDLKKIFDKIELNIISDIDIINTGSLE